MAILGSDAPLGRFRLGHGDSPDLAQLDPYHPTIVSGLPTPTGARPIPIPCLPISGGTMRRIWIRGTNPITPWDLFLTGGATELGLRGMVLIGGQLTQRIKEVPYLSGSVELAIDFESQRNLYKSTGDGTEFQIEERLVTIGGLRGAFSGPFLLYQPGAHFEIGDWRTSYQVAGSAEALLGPLVSGDLPMLAKDTAAGMSALYPEDGVDFASTVGIAAWLLQREGRPVTIAAGTRNSKPFSTKIQDGSGNWYTLGPFTVSPPQSAASLLIQALWIGRLYLTNRSDGTAVLSSWPTTAQQPWIGGIKWFGEADCEYPVIDVEPVTPAQPGTITVVNQSSSAGPVITTKTVAGGYGPARPHYFAAFDGSGVEQDYVNGVLQRQAEQAGASYRLRVWSDYSVRAGQVIGIRLPLYSVPVGLYFIAEANHPVGHDAFSTLLVEYL